MSELLDVKFRICSFEGSRMQSDITTGFIKAIADHALAFAVLFVIVGLALSFFISRAEKFLIKSIRQRGAERASHKITPKIPERAGVVEAPECPQCGSKMVLRKARRGARADESFWGCSRYPACGGIRQC